MSTPTDGRTAGVENPHAGEGPVLLDIGGDVGALVVRMPADTVGLEVEIRPVSTATGGPASRSSPAQVGAEAHVHDHVHGQSHPHRHVAVVARAVATGVAHTLVYEGLQAGRYELHALPAGPVVLTIEVEGGEVTRADWPT